MISVGCEKVSDTAVRLWVNNPGEIPADVRGHIFHRSFSTKGPGRGLGTHSIRIFTENFLGGTAGFTTNATDGTTFYAELPLVIPNNPTS
jgi:sensor histidine kinase regulating citrate/malate metabolism